MSRWRARAAFGLAGGITLASAMVGCMTDQSADVGLYRAIADPPGNGPVHPPGGDLSLPDALRLTALRNEQLAVRGEGYIQALADRQRAAAALRPTVDLFADVALRENTGNAAIVQSDLGVTGQYRLLTGLSDLRNVSAADARIESRRWLILDLRESLLLQAARAYYETLRSERVVAVLESSVAAQSERLNDARARNEVGFARPLDVAQIEAQVSRTRAQLITAVRQAGEARSTLALLTAAEIKDSKLSDGYSVATDDRDSDAYLALAERTRQDVLAARAEAEAARSLVDAAIGQYAPSISVNLDYFLARGPDDSAASIASLIQVRVPIFSAGRIEADIRGAWSVFRQRVLEYRLRVREVRRDVETAVLQLRASVERAAELRTQVRVARDALELAEAAYQAGLGTNLERVTAQDQLLTAELEATSEEFTTKSAALALLRACGLLSGDMIQTELPEASEGAVIAPESPVLDRNVIEGNALDGDEPRANPDAPAEKG